MLSLSYARDRQDTVGWLSATRLLVCVLLTAIQVCTPVIMLQVRATSYRITIKTPSCLYVRRHLVSVDDEGHWSPPIVSESNPK